MAGQMRYAASRDDDDWRSQALRQLAGTRELDRNEDGFTPVRPEPSVIRTTETVIAAIKRDYLPIPFVSASADGGITLEWRKPASRLTINIRAIGEVGYFGAREPNYTCEGELTDGNFDFINEVVDILLVR